MSESSRGNFFPRGAGVAKSGKNRPKARAHDIRSFPLRWETMGSQDRRSRLAGAGLRCLCEGHTNELMPVPRNGKYGFDIWRHRRLTVAIASWLTQSTGNIAIASADRK